jgi:predicted O-methyltransferase YrrM
MDLLNEYIKLGSKTDKEWGHKYISYFYNDKFMKYKNKKIKLLEIGVESGYSIELWKSFFLKADIIGVDVKLGYKPKNSDDLYLYEMDAYSDKTIDFLLDKHGKFDIIIDDGPHTYESQDFFLKNYDKILNEGGLIVLEDVPLSYIDKLMEYNPNYSKLETDKPQMNYDNDPRFNTYNDSAIIFKTMNQRSGAIENIVSAWKGHRDFAESIVKILNPKIIVDLGVDWGYSSFCFANPDIGKVYAIDLFCPNEYNNINTLEHVNNFKDAYNFSNLEFIQADFCDLAKSWTHEIDILHIDGWHSYEEVKRDFNTWSKFVSENGIILMHDTEERSFGVKQFFNEIQLPKFNFLHSSGLGVVCKNETTFNSIKHLFKN